MYCQHFCQFRIIFGGLARYSIALIRVSTLRYIYLCVHTQFYLKLITYFSSLIGDVLYNDWMWSFSRTIIFSFPSFRLYIYFRISLIVGRKKYIDMKNTQWLIIKKMINGLIIFLLMLLFWMKSPVWYLMFFIKAYIRDLYYRLSYFLV